MADDLTEIQKLNFDYQLMLAKKHTEFLEMQEAMRSRERKLELLNYQLTLENQNLKLQNTTLKVSITQFQADFKATYKNYMDLFNSSTNIGNEYDALFIKLLDEIDLKTNELEKFTRAPKVKSTETDKFWKPYKIKFDDYIKNGKKESWAINEIKKQIGKDGNWQQQSKKDPSKILSTPDRGTIRRRLIDKPK